MNKRQVIDAMYNAMNAADAAEAEKIKNGGYNTAAEIEYDRRKAMDRALNIAIKNGYSGACKWQLWKIVVDRRARDLNIKPNN